MRSACGEAASHTTDLPSVSGVSGCFPMHISMLLLTNAFADHGWGIRIQLRDPGPSHSGQTEIAISTHAAARDIRAAGGVDTECVGCSADVRHGRGLSPFYGPDSDY